KIGDAEVGLVEDLESNSPGLRKTESRHFETQFWNSFLRDQQRGSVLGNPVIDAGLFELLDHRAGVFGRKGRIERTHSALALTARARHDASSHSDGDDQNCE